MIDLLCVGIFENYDISAQGIGIITIINTFCLIGCPYTPTSHQNKILRFSHFVDTDCSLIKTRLKRRAVIQILSLLICPYPK